MEDTKKKCSKAGFYSHITILLVIAGILINILGTIINKVLGLPLYLDSIGTILITALSGVVPGVVVGFFSNVINSIQSAENAYYAAISVLLAIVVAFFVKKGYFESFKKTLLMIVPCAIIGGVLGSIITFLIDGLGINTVSSLYLGNVLFKEDVVRTFLDLVSSGFLYDVVDKGISIIVAFLIFKLIPKDIKQKLVFRDWKQEALTPEMEEQVKKNSFGKTSLHSKLISLISITLLVVATVTTAISYFLYQKATIQEHQVTGKSITKVVANLINGDDINRYISEGDNAAGYKEIEEEMKVIRDSSNDVLYVYVYKIDEEGCHVVFDLDTEELEGSNPGDLIPFDESFSKYIPSLLAGEEIEPMITNDTFGWLLTVYEPIKDSNGITQAYACTDVSMLQVKLSSIEFLTKIISLFFGFLLVIIVIGHALADFHIVYPINSMAITAGKFAYQSEEDRNESIKNFKSLKINTDDEIENLYNSFSMTMEETIEYIKNVQQQAKVISKMQNGLILVMADMVESRDQCTGDHVRKTAEYCRIILEQLRENGEFKDILTDDYIEDVVNSAPLHDIGKIKVSDTILNKPGKLTPEEFEEMKKHTTAGGEIIQEAMELVSSNTGYLKEAKNLATYHHEKWNGAGYPMGLSGDDIPLSARVMAVADVFDALVSRRSYKEPYPFEKALSIIEESSGSHFDPRVVKAFFDRKEEVKKVSEINMAKEQANYS